MERIEGGFYLKARRVQETWIAKAPPHIREIWDWILLNANYRDNGKIKRGQLLTTYQEIQDGLSWYVGYRKESYKKHHCETALKALTRQLMTTTTRTTRGVIITVLNYNKYQDPKNYETYGEACYETTRDIRESGYDKERKEEGRKEREDIVETEPRQVIPYFEIVSHLNHKTGKQFNSSTQSTKAHIRARWAEGYRLDDFKIVIDSKTDEWLTNADMNQYLRPTTLFGTKFESYLQTAKTATATAEANLYGKFGKWKERDQSTGIQ